MTSDGSDRRFAALAAAVEAVLGRLGDGPDDTLRPLEPLESCETLNALSACFGLTRFERELLMLCAAAELVPATSGRIAGCDAGRDYPTFRLALARLAEPHWNALTPSAPLRRFRLIEVDADGVLLSARLRIDERVLHFLAGAPYLDARLAGLVTNCPVPDRLPPSHRKLADDLAAALDASGGDADVAGPVDLVGDDSVSRREVAAAAADTCGLGLYTLNSAELPSDPTEREALARLWEREAVLLPAALLIEVADTAVASAYGVVEAFAGGLTVPVVLSARDPIRTTGGHRRSLTIEPLPSDEQLELWQEALPQPVPTDDLGRLVAQFSLPGHVIRLAGAAAAGSANGAGMAAAAWRAGLDHARIGLEEMGRRIEPTSSWNDLVLPAPQLELLRQVVAHVRRRAVVYRDWGFDRVLRRGLGISALFAGPSGTGKTLAAEVIAGELGLDMFVIDLSQVVSKYIGETEKNLRGVFDAAERGGAVLVFDEADALFGKRSEVRDSHDRYANLEVSYLLTRMETYRGLAVLTTNTKKALDPAFLRRLRFVVDFPFPGATERAEIWRRLIPDRVPVEALRYDRLAALTIAGGNIRNIALGAAFLAADEGAALSMRHLRAAAQAEYIKNERTLGAAEVSAWN